MRHIEGVTGEREGGGRQKSEGQEGAEGVGERFDMVGGVLAEWGPRIGLCR